METVQQNSIVERKYQHILIVIQSLLFQSKIPLVFLSYVVINAIYLMGGNILTPLFIFDTI